VGNWVYQPQCFLSSCGDDQEADKHHPQLIHTEDNYAKSFRRSDNFQNSRTDGKEDSKTGTGEKVKLKHVSTLTAMGGWGLFFSINLSPLASN
jgi:hypothetical protein